MRHQAVYFVAALLALSTFGCGGDDDDASSNAGGSTGTGGGGTGVGGGSPGLGGVQITACESTSTDDEGNRLVMLNESSNYTFSSTLALTPIPVAARTDLTFDWSAVTMDFVGQAVDPLADVDMVTLILWNLSSAEFATKLNDDALVQNDFEALIMFYTNNAATSASASQFTSFGNPVPNDYLMDVLDPNAYDPATHIYTVMVVTGTTAGVGTRMVQAFTVDANSSNTQVALTSDSTQLTYSADITSLTPLGVPAGDAGIALDWGGMTSNAMGREFVTTQITDVQLAHYSMTPAELQDQFLGLLDPTTADQMWTGSVPSGTSVVLSSLTDEGGQPFSGIDDTGTWIVALFCGDCMNPAPWYLSRVETCVQ